MSGNSLGTLYCLTSFGESHGPAIGGVIDGCPPGLELSAADIQKDFYAELPIQVKVIGTYHDMGAFAGDVGQLSRIVTLNDVSIIAGRDGNLSMDATARTFRYLNDDEVQNQRRSAAAKKAPAKK